MFGSIIVYLLWFRDRTKLSKACVLVLPPVPKSTDSNLKLIMI